MRVWPVGVWRRIDGRSPWQLKTGGMLVVTLRHGIFVAYAHTSQGHVSSTPCWAAVPTQTGALRIIASTGHPDAARAQGVVSLSVNSTNQKVLTQR